MKKILLLALLLPTIVAAQKKYTSEKSYLSFFSDAVVEDIKAENSRVTSIIDVAKGELAFLLKIKDFEFEKKLMQVHFNEKYLESEKYPKATFLGRVKGFDPAKTGSQTVTATGRLFIHGIYRDVTVPGTMEQKGNNITIKAAFKVRLEDYNIEVPQILFKNIAEEVEVKLEITYIPL